MATLTSEQLAQYEDQGYLFLRGLFDPKELQPLTGEVDGRVDELAREYQDRGLIDETHDDLGFKTRLIELVRQCDDVYGELQGGTFVGPELFGILSHPKLVDIAESVVGPETHCEGRHRLRPKLPNYGTADFRWHEDTPYIGRRLTYVQQQYGLGTEDPSQSGRILSRIVAAPQMAEPGFWIPLVDVDEENGCLHLLPGGHRHTPPFDHQWEPDSFVQELDGLTPAPMPMKVGDALLIQQHLPHVSPPNRSDHVRWSVDIRYQDGRLRTKSAREPGFLARSVERPEDVVTTYEGYVKIREAVAQLQEATGIRL